MANPNILVGVPPKLSKKLQKTESFSSSLMAPLEG